MIIDFNFIKVTPIIVPEKIISKNITSDVVAWTPIKGTYDDYVNPICIREGFYKLLNEEEFNAVCKHEALHLYLKHKDSYDIKNKESIKEIYDENEEEVNKKLSKKELELISGAHKKYLK